ncbi:3-hydroxyacyl-CoA dehydrogenase/enoyl-CoA hydratase family protein [Rhodospirillum centenum]|uniref:3-hydroxyacyl-CoA dehydrogenase, putative n=1 Tax=Rhodospirillum centenum (strain ATCC 51521 / SW) TaxID=414684 RepID=B6ITP2_RHOCS|nr:3-hydroxyacyl-CoA dehydrogenase NAD-binding domain-containing protein [Rhodospirillum centenum]ACI99343.1 3-hydroxyacyl-CoA dehydrogenase, putative [Rhodospirillum centenum SW]
MEIRSAAVIGAGVMGSGIAAHIANAGIPVFLLDIVPQAVKDGQGNDRSVVARTAVEKMLKTDPAPFMHRKAAGLITPGNLEDDLDKLAGVDWIVEAIVENPAIKSDLYRKLDAVRKPGSVVSSNTSTIPLRILLDGQSEQFAQDFLITHFFNPPRYMRLLEIVKGERTRADAVEAVARFCDVALGKGVVTCKDTPGFIANRIGTYFMQAAVNEAIDGGLTVEEADAISGRPMGLPKTGTFGLIDLVGLDLMPLIAKSLLATLPADDDYRRIFRTSPVIERMIAEGYTGRKGKGGFYRQQKLPGGKRSREALDLGTGQYRPQQRTALESAGVKGLRALVDHPDKGGRYAWRVLSQALTYAADLVPQIADTVVEVDEAMRLGYNWKWGPFEMIDQLGTGWFAEKLAAEGKRVPELLAVAAGRPFYRVENGKLQFLGVDGDYRDVKRPDGVLLLSDVKRASKPVAKNGSAALWDIGDGVLCLEFTSKMNALDTDIMAMIRKAIETIGNGKAGPFKALVIHNESDNFSVGANLGLAMFAVNIGLWPQIEAGTAEGQATYKALKYAPFPTVGAPSGMALGGGCEILLHCSAVQAHAESYIGLVEVGVGLIPGWGGCKELLTRATVNKKRPGGPMPPIAQVFETISTAKVAKSAFEAKELLFLRPTDGITFNRYRLLADAKKKALEMAAAYEPPQPVEIRLPGPSAKMALEMAVEGFALQGKATPHDITVSKALAFILSGGNTDITKPVTEDDLLALERDAFIGLVKTTQTIDRIEHMLETGKPLRN